MIDMGLATMIGSIGSAALSTAGGALANYQNSQMDSKNREWNEKMWNQANEYNLPINQMERLRQAHLNPNLVYGNGANTLTSYAGNLASNRQAQNIFKDAQLGMSILDAQRVKNETLVAESQARKNNAEARSAEVKASVDEQSVDEYVSGVKTALDKMVEEKELTRLQGDIAWRVALDMTNEINAKEEYRFPVLTTDENGNYTHELHNYYDLMGDKLFKEFIKAGFDAQVSQKMVGNILASTQKFYSDIRVNQATEQNIITDSQLKKTEQAYYESLRALNYAQREKIFSDINVNNAIVKNLGSVTNLNQVQAQKFTTEALELLRNGQTQRFKDLVINRFGNSGVANQIINLFYNAVMLDGKVHVDPRDMTPYYGK